MQSEETDRETQKLKAELNLSKIGIRIEPEKEPGLGICYECSTKDADSSPKNVYHCDLCNKWFCEQHLKPKFPYFVDWDTMFDVQGNPEVKALFYSEYGRQDGHPDFVYLRKTIEALEIEERIQNQLIEQAMDKMVESTSVKKPLKQVKRDVTTYPTEFSSPKSLNRKIGISIVLILALIISSIVATVYFANLSSSPINPQDVSWSSYNYTLEPDSQYTITITANNGYSFDSWAYVTSNHWSSTQIYSTQSSLTVSGDVMSLNAYFVPKVQTNQGSAASITLIPTSTMQLDLEVRDGTANLRTVKK